MNRWKSVLSIRNKRAARIAHELREVLPDLVFDIASARSGSGRAMSIEQAIESITTAQLVEILRAALPAQPAPIVVSVPGSSDRSLQVQRGT